MTAASVGPAVREAAADAKAQLLGVASKFLGITRKSAKLENGIVRGIKRGQKVEQPLAEILEELGDIMVVGHGSRAPNPTNVEIRTFGAQFAEVEVDIETGAIRVLKIVASHDCGRILNPLTTSSQIEGGVIQGLGYALMEQRITDENTGMVVNPNLEGYRIPTMMDIPEIEVRMIDRADPLINNLGAKGVGEPPIIPTAPAIANAVADAIGVRLHKLPMTRDVVLEGMHDLPHPLPFTKSVNRRGRVGIAIFLESERGTGEDGECGVAMKGRAKHWRASKGMQTRARFAGK
jgi:xanthine dehydrogenase YagR molybdenum-binding subunit